MKATFMIACLAGTSLARQLPRNLDSDPDFVEYLSCNNKNYTSRRELKLRAQIFKQNVDIIN